MSSRCCKIESTHAFLRCAHSDECFSFSASYSRISHCFTAGKRTGVGDCQLTRRHRKTTIFASEVYATNSSGHSSSEHQGKVKYTLTRHLSSILAFHAYPRSEVTELDRIESTELEEGLFPPFPTKTRVCSWDGSRNQDIATVRPRCPTSTLSGQVMTVIPADTLDKLIGTHPKFGCHRVFVQHSLFCSFCLRR
jgi:hypothetical protein